jgi:hypothetical protein
MEIYINGEKADIVIETEKTVGQVLAGLEEWLCNSDPRFRGTLRLSGMEIDGQTISVGSLEDSFNRELASIKTLGIKIMGLPGLLAEALIDTRRALVECESMDFAGKQGCGAAWEARAAAGLLKEQSPVLYKEIVRTFMGEGLSSQGLAILIDERLRELEDPVGELGRMETLIREIVGRLEGLSLDIQTGKDRRAVETVQLFSSIVEKVFRIYNFLEMEGFPVQDIKVMETQSFGPDSKDAAGEIPVGVFIGKFNAAMTELLEAFESRDAVLVGDMAEYELAPRLRDLYAALRSPGLALPNLAAVQEGI